ncbi:hypothetical protein [Nannocystis punicea]|uniref:Uncharacterized protein n=1 Tax=Nannocystis punicea TaxID=2995304 RepID=A0ABY7HHQ4_9BACT|nr:hypothetical protein [Nannocystis poenicansa]WAS98841.1 hypothetical protein O0S08_22145 [Nannocystis poenicansa]
MRLTAIVAPAPDRPLHPTEVTPRVFDHVDEFAEALSLAAGRPVPIVEGVLADAPAEGFLVYFRPFPMGSSRFPPRSVGASSS